MTPPQANVKDIFEQAVEIDSPEQRNAFLDEACAVSPDVRREVEELLEAYAQAGSFLDPTDLPPTGPGGTTNRSVECGSTIAGRYKLLQQIGEGGMGTVFMAEQTQPVKRRVAVKLIHADRGNSKTILARFEAERQAIAMMDHPHIAKLLEAGTTDTGSPFFVMDLVKGVSLTEYCDTHKLSIPDRLNLFMKICSAVQHAHQKGIIHRDLKPSNILVESHDGKPVPKVIDFGVAKATSGMQLSEQTLFTGFGSVVGTPLYMAPEQATFNAVDVDTRADLYALGVILYELLTGSTPITRETIKKMVIDEILRLIREQEAPTPSSRLSSSESKPSIAANRQSEPLKLGRFLKGELDWIVLKALSKERDRRYETANGFARDVERFLNHEPVSAGPPTAGYKFRKFVRRNRGPVVAASVVLLVLLAGIAGTTFGLLRADQRRKEAELAKSNETDQRKEAEEANRQAFEALQSFTGELIVKQFGSRSVLTENEKSILRNAVKQWEVFANSKGDSADARSIRAVGAGRVAFLQQYLGLNAEAEVNVRTAVSTGEKLVADFPDVPKYGLSLAKSHLNLGKLLFGLSRNESAEEQYRFAQAIQQKLSDNFTNVPDYRSELALTHINLGVLLAHVGKWDAAEEEYRLALHLLEPLANGITDVPEYQFRLANAHLNIGNMSARRANPNAAEAFGKAIEILGRLIILSPDVPDYQAALGKIHNSLGESLRLREKPGAEEQYRKALNIQERLASELPAVPDYQVDLANTHNNLGLLLFRMRKWSAAEEQHRKSTAILERTTARFPDVPAYLSDLASARTNLANVLLGGLGKPTAAEEEYKKALAIKEKLVDDHPTVPDYQLNLGGGYCDFGHLRRDGGQPEDSLFWFGKAIQTLRAVYDRDRQSVEARIFLRNSYWGRAAAHDLLKQFAEALKDRDEAIALSPKAHQRFIRAQRVNSLVGAGLIAEAIAEVADLAKSGPWDPDKLYNFACVYALASGKIADKKQEYADQGIDLLQKAVNAGYKDAAHMKKDTDLDPLRDREDFKKLLAELEKKSPPPKKPSPPTEK